MGHGRHRRQRRGRALRATLAGTALALTAAATLISTSQAAGDDDPGPLTPLTSSAERGKLQLHENLVRQSSLDTLTQAMGGNVGVHGVLQSANHPMRNKADCDGTERAALPVEPEASRAYCWDTGDATTQKWLPQSVTTSGDADDDGKWGEDRVILAGWTHNDHKAGEPADDRGLARVAFIDANDPAHLKYRWVLLVAPLSGGTDFGAVRSHLGGMVWYQDKLIVTAKNGADHDNALFVFDMHRILQADVDSSAVGKVSGGFSAHGYQYVLPAIGSYNLTGGACDASDDDHVPCFASVSLDRTSSPDSLVANEWFSSGGTQPARLWRYYFSTQSTRTGLLGTDANDDAGADEAYETKAVGVQGVLSHRRDGADKADWYVGQAPGARGKHGTLWRQSDSGADAATCTADRTKACWGQHTESLSYWQETGELWTLTEWAADADNGWEGTPIPERVLYAVPLSSVDDTVD
ncbi:MULTISPECIES: hypothetical protein [unclassified Streptomyces]|uniref:hypothetical protein n=1 Tax=unclassified Streptomyces TaxID=2593676 RepID=UPI0004C218E3|nr:MULTISPECIES: hypothetical protein [unclassified Streptomyces]